ncbi:MULTISPECIES: ABC transporter permease [Actinoalloteichus]|uniref:ABC transporter n=1 Tax=Actinoalloteichus fjordicus TaxID=1612552 RepID=A0AAC9PSK5_9PSEU|nr:MULTISPECIES: ABC transporter permease [Actinoalloteichus]APU15649.1 hypothetical protein UA74_18105 [Actinoalloteichus fjordicus]APU21709.1 hypothetical protein UA75_18595 [Actinoalloteichus sp. GBA129-24]
MGPVTSEFLKLKRSTSWAVVVLLPVIMVIAGSVSTLAGDGGFADGWHTLWIRSIGFYGMVILSVGIAILASLVWRVEHRNSNWNALMSGPVPTAHVVLGKLAAIAVLAAAMQLVFVATVIVLGRVAFGLPGMLPAEYYVSSVLVIVACVPVAALQSALSTFFRSFAAPVAIALVCTGACTMALLLGVDVVAVLPYALLTQATQIGTALVSGEATSFEASALTLQSAAFVVLVAVVLTAVIVAVTSMLLDRSDTRV